MAHLSLPHSPCAICVEVSPTYDWSPYYGVCHLMQLPKWNGHVTPVGAGRRDLQCTEATLEMLVGVSVPLDKVV